MKNKSKGFHVLLLTAALFLLLTGCRGSLSPAPDDAYESGNDVAYEGENKDAAKPSIVCTAFPQYDWTLQILGSQADQFQVTLLNHQGADMHSFQPTAANMVSMATCDLFIHIGGYSESWVPAALKSAENQDAAVLTLLDHVDRLEEVSTPGMTPGSRHDHSHSHDHDDSPVETSSIEADEDHDEPRYDEDDADADADVEYDEHLWLSLSCAQDACRAIAGAVTELDPDHAEEYAANLADYSSRLARLDTLYEETVDRAPVKALLFADRFPFRYMACDYDIECFAAFPGCSAETEASFETIVALSEEMSAHQIQAAVILEGSRTDFAKTVIASAGMPKARILTLNSMQSAGQREADAGVTYLSIMENNLQVLKIALQSE